MDEPQSASLSAFCPVACDYKDEMLERSTTLGLVSDRPANGHYPSDIGRDSGVELTGFNTSRGLSGDASFFPDNFCIGEDGEDLTYCHGPDLQGKNITFENFSLDDNTSHGLSGDASFFPDNFCIGEDGEDLTHCLGPDLQGKNTTFENFSLDDESAFVIKLVNFQENTSQLSFGNEHPSFDFSEFIPKLKKENDSWKMLESKAQNLLVKSKGKPERSKERGSPDQDAPPKRKLEMISNEKSNIPSKEQQRLRAAESHRRATAKRTRIQGRFKRRQHVWVNIGEDGRKIAE
eukprot:g2963.t1